MPYPEMMIAPMRQDLVRVGFSEMWLCRRDDASRCVHVTTGGEEA